jgi:oxygen-independent coproporphyrinogen III oxidase
VCFYCACNKIITNNRSRAQPYLDRLYREIALQGALYDRSGRWNSCTGAAARPPS